jgi:hypothetical protein
MLIWPGLFSVHGFLYFILEPINIWLAIAPRNGRKRDWRLLFPVARRFMYRSFWEMWNFLSYPKWVYHVPWGDWLHILKCHCWLWWLFAFALELYAISFDQRIVWR